MKKFILKVMLLLLGICNFSAAGNCSLTKYYIDTDINEIIKSNNDYTCGFSFLHLNTRSITFSKFNNCLSLIDINFFVIGLTETWLNNKNSYELTDYRNIHLTRP